jgi:hypothetical protein
MTLSDAGPGDSDVKGASGLHTSPWAENDAATLTATESPYNVV